LVSGGLVAALNAPIVQFGVGDFGFRDHRWDVGEPAN
jgi:hypothetical protein